MNPRLSFAQILLRGVLRRARRVFKPDTLGRFSAVSSGTNVFAYSYLPGSDLVSGMTANSGHAWERIYEPDRDLIATVHNRYGDRTISRFDYTNDEIGRRVARVDSGEAFAETAYERYSYNGRSEVVSARRFYGSDIADESRPVPGRTKTIRHQNDPNAWDDTWRNFSAGNGTKGTIVARANAYFVSKLPEELNSSESHTAGARSTSTDIDLKSDIRSSERVLTYRWNLCTDPPTFSLTEE